MRQKTGAPLEELRVPQCAQRESFALAWPAGAHWEAGEQVFRNPQFAMSWLACHSSVREHPLPWPTSHLRAGQASLRTRCVRLAFQRLGTVELIF